MSFLETTSSLQYEKNNLRIVGSKNLILAKPQDYTWSGGTLELVVSVK